MTGLKLVRHTISTGGIYFHSQNIPLKAENVNTLVPVLPLAEAITMSFPNTIVSYVLLTSICAWRSV